MDIKRIELRLPSDRSMLLVVRMTTAGIMSRAGLTLDEADDMKMAIDESCTLMTLQQPSCTNLHLTYEYCEEKVCVHITAEAADCPCSQTSVDQTTMAVIRCILEAMVDEVRIETSPNGAASVHLCKRLPESRRVAP